MLDLSLLCHPDMRLPCTLTVTLYAYDGFDSFLAWCVLKLRKIGNESFLNKEMCCVCRV